MPSTFLFKDHPSPGLHLALAEQGVDERLARRLQAAVIRTRADRVPTSLVGVRRDLLERVARHASVPALTCLERETSPTDGSTRFLFRGADDELFEAVRIPLLHRPGKERCVVCVSSQAGCAMGCAFCATGRLGWKRDLETWEMVDQVLAIQAESEWPVRSVVFLGMGEPLLNYERVLRAAAVLNEPCGTAIDAKSISISTCGVVPGIHRMADSGVDYRLIVSLTAATDAKRQALMPVGRSWPLDALFDALRHTHARNGRRVLLAWVMIAEVNMGEEDAIALGELTRDLPCLVDLIPVNDPSGRYRPPTRAEVEGFVTALRRHVAQPIQCRYSAGADIGAACGMLVAQRRTAIPSCCEVDPSGVPGER